MMSRCTNQAHPRWADWGGRGITVCESWRDFASFLADMGERPAGTTLDRIDNDGDYVPTNCRWATAVEQNRNKRSTKLTRAKVLEIRDLLADGLGIAAVSAESGIDRHAVGTVATTIAALRSEPHA